MRPLSQHGDTKVKGMQTPSTLMSPAAALRLKRLKEAEEWERNQASRQDVFTPLSKDAEQFSGNLFKVGMLMISVPLAGAFKRTYLRGLRAHDILIACVLYLSPF